MSRSDNEREVPPRISHREFAEVLAGRASYDDLASRSQAIVRAEWAEQLDQNIRDLDLVSEFAAAGRSFAYLDADGEVAIERPAQRS